MKMRTTFDNNARMAFILLSHTNFLAWKSEQIHFFNDVT